MTAERPSPDDIGWEIEVDPASEELRLEHVGSGTTYVLDSSGGMRVPGEAEAGHDLAALQTAVTAALEPSARGQTVLPDGGGSRSCRLECDEETGEVIIRSDTKISLEAPQIELSSEGNTSLTADGVLTLEGALIELN